MKVSENKPHSIHLRLTEDQYSHCKINAELMGIGVADYIRMIVNAVTVTAEKLHNVTLGDLANENAKGDIEHQL